MKLLIVSHTPHYYSSNGSLVGWGATVREIDYLAQIFDEITHVAPLYTSIAPKSSLPYKSDNIRFHAVHPAGGDNFSGKLEVGAHILEYQHAIIQEAKHADVVHVRCPSNIGLITLLISNMKSLPTFRWVKYAGNWNPIGKESFSYSFQRWILQKNYFNGVVTINGTWPNQPKHVYSFYNPCLTDAELEIGKAASMQKELTPPYQLLYVGRLETAKGVGRILQIGAILKKHGVPFELNFIGDGPEKEMFISQAKEMNIANQTVFNGWLARTDLGQYYAKANFLLLPSSSSEGWPKVLSEAMAYGVVPIASNVSSIPQILRQFETGITLDSNDIQGYVSAIEGMIIQSDLWKNFSTAATAGAYYFTYSYYLSEVRQLFQSAWNLTL